MARWLRVRVLPTTTLINGPGSGALIIEAGGKCMWSRRLHAYVCNQFRADKVMALADHAGYRVEYIDERQQLLIDLSPTRDEDGHLVGGGDRDVHGAGDRDVRQPELDLGDAS